MKKIVAICFLFFAAGMFAQQEGIIKGHILDQEMANEPLMFANLELKGAEATVQSNLFGRFEISDVEPGSYILEISHAGYETVELPVEVKANEVTEIQQSLAAERLSLEEFDLITENNKVVENLNSGLASRQKE